MVYFVKRCLKVRILKKKEKHLFRYSYSKISKMYKCLYNFNQMNILNKFKNFIYKSNFKNFILYNYNRILSTTSGYKLILYVIQLHFIKL